MPRLGAVTITRQFFKGHLKVETPKVGPSVFGFDGLLVDPDYVPSKMEPCEEAEANMLGSATNLPGVRLPLIDIDVPDSLELVPSSTPGHSHLYVNVPMTARQEQQLVNILTEVGLVEQGFRDVARKRGMTTVRLPGVQKVMAVAE